MTRSFHVIVVLLGMLVDARGTLAQEGQQHRPEPPKQVYCPVTPEVEIDPEVFTEFEGKLVYFCSERCRAEFMRDPERYVTRLISTGAPVEKQPPAPTEPSHQHEHEHTPEAVAPDHGHAQAPTEGDSTEHGHEGHEHGIGPRWIAWIGRFHPAMVNLPIGVIGAGALAETLFLIRRRSLYGQAAHFCAWFGAITGVGAGFLGWCFGGFHLVDSDWLLATHRWLGTGTVACLLGLLWANKQAHGEAPHHVGLYRTLLFVSAALVVVTGFFGGSMVYGIDHYVR